MKKQWKESEKGQPVLSIICPACSKPGAKIIFNVHEIPYFGEVMESVLICENCNYKHVDIEILEEREPARYTLKVETEEDLNARVLRSSSGTIRIPELGVEVFPGRESMGFITNVEGVLERVKEAIGMAERWAEEEEKKLRARELLEKIDRITSGKESMTLIVEDPTGNSAIISKKVKKEKLK